MGMINGKTKLVGLLGQPVNHSLSPAIHNAALQEMGINWCYVALPCKKENLQPALKTLRDFDCKGLNITIPHKNSIVPLCAEVNLIAKRIGAVNTLIPHQNGGWKGLNTDIEGFLAPLKTTDWEDKEAVIIGCGGSARAVFAGLEKLKLSKITIVGRKESSINQFLTDLEIFSDSFLTSKRSITGLLQDEDLALIERLKTTNLVVNTTPIGMQSSGDKRSSPELAMPLGQEIWSNLHSNTLLYDLIYTPRPTPWLNWGRNQGMKTIDGLEMLIQQGAASLRLWTGKHEIPIDVMREKAKNCLKI